MFKKQLDSQWGRRRKTEDKVVKAFAEINLTGSLLIISYLFIFIIVMKFCSSEGQCKALSTCASHLIAVTMFYGSLFCMYLRAANEQSVQQGKVMGMFCIFVNPMFNTFITSLRNKNVTQALRRVFRKNIGTMEKSSLSTVSKWKNKSEKQSKAPLLGCAEVQFSGITVIFVCIHSLGLSELLMETRNGKVVWK